MKISESILLGLLLLGSFKSFSQQMEKKETQTTTQFPEASAFANSTFTYKIIKAANNTFGYDIFADNKLMIHQPTIPGQPGVDGFKDKESAEKVANLVINKIKKGEMPPSVSPEEMKKLNAIK